MTENENEQPQNNQTFRRSIFRMLTVFLLVLGLIVPFAAVFAAIPSISSSPITEGVVGQSYSYTVVASGPPAPTFTLTTAPDGMVIDEVSGEISWTPGTTQTGSADVTVVATNIDGTDTQIFAIDVASLPNITSLAVTDAVVDQAYSYTVIATGEPAPTFTLSTFPAGMTVDEFTGEISWTPTDATNVDVTVQAVNAAGMDTQSFTIDVTQVPTFTSSPITMATVGVAYSYTAVAAGDPSPTFTLTTAPTGMIIDEFTGEVNWTPTDATDANVTIQAVNSAGTADQSFSIIVTEVPTITSTPITTGTVNTLYEYTVLATGDPSPTFTLTTAPTGMTINDVSGLISWTPQDPGVYDVTVEAVNSAGTADQSFAVVVDAVCPAGALSYWRLDETSGTSFADYLGANPALFAGAGSPGFVSGVVNGAVDMTGSNQRLETSNAANPSAELTVMAWVNPDDLGPPDRGILSKEDAFSLGIESDGDQISFSIINGGQYFEFEPDVPENMIAENEWAFIAATFDGVTRILRIYINGTEVGNTVGPFSAVDGVVTAYQIGWDANFETNRFFDGTVDEVAVYDRALTPSEIQLQYSRTLAGEGYCDAGNAAPNIVSTPTTNTTAGLTYTYDVNASGNPGITYSLVNPPTGMTIDSVTGVITWVPTVSGDFTIRVRATNSEGQDSQNYTLTVTAVAPDIISSPVTGAITGHLYTYDVDATGLPAPTYSLTTNPAGMAIDPNTGIISWPSPTTGSHDVTVEASNDGGTDVQSFSIDVVEPSSVCPSNLFSYWRLDETTGTLFADSYGANDTTFSGTGNPSFTTGQVNGALNFNGSDQRLTSASTSNPTSAVTLMAWINPDDLSGTNDRGIISKNGAFVLEIETAVGGIGSNNGLSFTIINGSFFEFEPNVPANSIPTNTWSHVVATFDGTTASIYINGQLVSSTASPLGSIGDTVSAFNIGYTDPFGTNRYFDGIIDEVAVFDEALTLNEIQEIYNNTLIGDTYCEIAPQITSQPITNGAINALFTYDVDATGNPEPTYILVNKPADMTIDANTGVISWTPTTYGTFNVSVQAQNFAGFEQQDFQIVVPAFEIYLPMILR